MDDRQKEDLRYTVVSDSMIVLKSPLMTTQEIVESVRKLAIINWGDEAKAKLAAAPIDISLPYILRADNSVPEVSNRLFSPRITYRAMPE